MISAYCRSIAHTLALLLYQPLQILLINCKSNIYFKDIIYSLCYCASWSLWPPRSSVTIFSMSTIIQNCPFFRKKWYIQIKNTLLPSRFSILRTSPFIRTQGLNCTQCVFNCHSSKEARVRPANSSHLEEAYHRAFWILVLGRILPLKQQQKNTVFPFQHLLPILKAIFPYIEGKFMM